MYNVGGKSSFGRIDEQYKIERLKELKLKGLGEAATLITRCRKAQVKTEDRSCKWSL